MKKTIIVLLLAAALILSFASCAKDKPPESDGAEPAPLEGIYRSEYGMLSFNGDGKSVRVDITPEFSEITGLPVGEEEGTYVFLFHNGQWRYDQAEEFRIRIDEEDFTFTNNINRTCEDTVAFFINGGEAVFTKSL